MTKGKYEKIMQDDVVGKPQSNEDGSKWVYIAEVKQEEFKSYFFDGKEKRPYKQDFGENLFPIEAKARSGVVTNDFLRQIPSEEHTKPWIK